MLTMNIVIEREVVRRILIVDRSSNTCYTI